MQKQKIRAKLRTCASCEWIFKIKNDNPECPQCQFGSYGAYYVYGNRAYTYSRTQKPWKDKKLFEFESKLNEEISRCAIKPGLKQKSTIINQKSLIS